MIPRGYYSQIYKKNKKPKIVALCVASTVLLTKSHSAITYKTSIEEQTDIYFRIFLLNFYLFTILNSTQIKKKTAE